MAIARGRRLPRMEDMEQDALLEQMVDSPTPYSAAGPETGVKVGDPTAQPSGPQATTQPIGAPTQLEPSGGVPSAPSSPSSVPAGGQWNDRYEWESQEGGPRVRDVQIGDASRVTGANTSGWGSGERGTESKKNTFLMIASNVDPRQPGAARALMARDDFKQFFPNAKLIDHPKGDLIDFGDGGPPVDVLRNAVAGGSGDAWKWPTAGGAGGGMAAPTGAPASGMQNVSGVSLPQDEASLLQGLIAELGFQPGEGDSSQGTFTGNTAPAGSPVKDLMAEIQAAQGGQQSPMDMQALLALLGQQRGA